MTQRGHRLVLYDVAPNERYVRSVAGDVTLVRGDIRDLPALLETMQHHHVETVLHTAGLIGAKVAEPIYTGFSINIGGAIAVAEACRLSGVRRLVFASTNGVYNRALAPTVPIHEDFPVGGEVAYSSSKVACEQVLRAYATQYGLEVALLRPAQVYGRGHYAGGSSGGLAMDSVVSSAVKGGPVQIGARFAGLQEYVYVKDVAQGAALACEKPLNTKSRAFNLGTGALTTQEDLASAIRQACPGARVEIAQAPPRPEPTRKDQPLDPSRSREELGYTPKFDLAQGVADFVKELRQAQKT
jgi:UDP-glucose 4-epimerase